ncbi:MAG: glycosyltransferase family 39 protein [Candidatus Gastranaerophilaceae bacterium]|jgi:4-amino-4-deoxy-L-arabinose transferase-like glycosyltransferase
MTQLLILLPFSPLLFIYLMFIKEIKDFRSSIFASTAIWGVFIVFITEFLSLFKLINPVSISISWIIITVISGYFLFKDNFKDFKFSNIKFFTDSSSLPCARNSQFAPSFLNSVIVFIFIIFLITLITGFLYPPNTWDSMTYHMSRIMHWIQNQTIAPYPTNIPRQLYLNPFSEFVSLHFQILTNNDYFANIPQWFAMVGSVIGVSLIAKELGANIRGQILASLFCVTIPMGIIQSSSNQTDYMVSFFLVGLIIYILKFIKEKKLLYIFMIAISLGLAILTKGTSYIFAFPFMFYFLIFLARKHKPVKALKYLLIITIVVFLINIGHFTRNYFVFKTPFTRKCDSVYIYNEKISPKLLTSNIVKTLSLHFGTFVPEWNQKIDESIINFHNLIHVDINDHAISFPSPKWYFGIIPLNFSETTSGNFYHLILILISTSLLFLPSVRKNKELLSYTLLTISSFLLFCILIKWQPWSSRLQLPFFVISSVFVGSILAKIKLQKTINVFFVVIMFFSFLPLLFCTQRSLVGYFIYKPSRINSYFNDRSVLLAPYKSYVQAIEISGCKNIGLVSNEDAYEYPLWMMLKDKNIIINHVNVSNETEFLLKKEPYKSFSPCAILRLPN